MKKGSINTDPADHESAPLFEHNHEDQPYDGNIFSLLCFWPVTRVLNLAGVKELESSDLWVLDKPLQSQMIKKELGALWEEQKQLPEPSLASAVLSHSRGGLFICFLIELVNLAWASLTPIILPYLISYLHPYSLDPDWWGWVYIGGIILAAVMSSLLVNHSFLMLNVVATKAMAGVQLLIYEKVLKIAVPEESGKIINLMTSDTEIIATSLSLIVFSISTPIQLGVVMYLLWGQIKYFCFVPIGVLILITPFAGCLGSQMFVAFEKAQTAKDERIKLISELTNSIRVVKFYAWEEAFMKKITDARENELSLLRQMYWWATAMYSLLLTAPDMSTAITFILYTLFNTPTLSILFTSLNLFDQLRWIMTILPMTLTQMSQFFVAVGRIQEFLLSPELGESSQPVTSNKNKLQITDGSFSWKKDQESLVLADINLSVHPGELVMVAGPVGSGKSSLAYALLGEVPQMKGTTDIQGNVCYVSQLAWIRNATIRDNILFGKAYENDRYQRVIQACALQQDLKELPNGDMTEIGEKGINLSGGQKQRVAIARAIYSDAVNFIFDDPLSAVDAHVGKHIFHHVIQNFLKDQTVLFITNQLQYLPQADKIIFLEKGKITAEGNFDFLMAEGGDFHKLMSSHGVFKEETETQITTEVKAQESTAQTTDRLIQDEEKEIGVVSKDVYWYYLSAGGLVIIVALFFLVLQQGCLTSATWWLQYWPQDERARAGTPSQRPEGFYIYIYTGLNVGSSLCLIFYFIAFISFGNIASSKVHKKALRGVIYSPASFFDTTPIGRITSRFSTDMQIIDNQLIITCFSTLMGGFSVLGILVAMGFGAPFVLLTVPVFAVIFFFFQNYYRRVSIQLQRLEAVSRSPLYSHFSETLNGVTTIRAWKAQGRFQTENLDRIDAHNRDWMALKYASAWFGLFLAHIGNGLQTLCFVSIIITRIFFRDSDFYDVGLMTIAISLAPQIVMSLRYFAESYTNVENEMNSIERTKAYSQLPRESEDLRQPDSQWPSKGKIEFQHIKMRYLPQKPLVLKGLSATIESCEKIGIVGRTGAGKSSLFQVLFRMVELEEGKILIDGQDIAKMGLKYLRRKLSIIPQDPTLFIGTLRYNLDPFQHYTDSEIWQALELAHLKKFISDLPNQLNEIVLENGSNFSVGQRQLLCMARALLQKPRILLMDEATANVDMDTDRAIQETIRTAFKNTTLLVIAHRLNSIMDLDKIMVMAKGKCAEFGTPAELLKKKGKLLDLVEASGKNSSAHLKKMAGVAIQVESSDSEDIGPLVKLDETEEDPLLVSQDKKPSHKAENKFHDLD